MHFRSDVTPPFPHNHAAHDTNRTIIKQILIKTHKVKGNDGNRSHVISFNRHEHFFHCYIMLTPNYK